MKRLPEIDIDDKTYSEFKAICAIQGTSMKAMITDWIEGLVGISSDDWNKIKNKHDNAESTENAEHIQSR